MQDLLYCPIDAQKHPEHEIAARGAFEWLWHHELFPDRAALSQFASYGITDLLCRAYPEATLERLRTAMDWTLWVFVIDDHLDEGTVDLMCLSARYDSYTRILRDGTLTTAPVGPERALADIRRRVLALGGEATLRRFAEHVANWFDSLLWEAANRVSSKRPTVYQYMRMREVTVGMYPEYALFDVSHGVQTGEAFWTDPDLNYMRSSAANLVAWSNDVFSYAKETRLMDPHNLPHLLEQQYGLSHESSVRRVVEMYNIEMVRFLESEQQLRQRARAELHVDAFVRMLRCWIRANLDWSYTSTRYGLRSSGPGLLSLGPEHVSRTAAAT